MRDNESDNLPPNNPQVPNNQNPRPQPPPPPPPPPLRRITEDFEIIRRDPSDNEDR